MLPQIEALIITENIRVTSIFYNLRRRRDLKFLESLENFLDVAFDFHFREDAADDPLLVDDDRSAFNPHIGFPHEAFFFPDTVIADHFLFLVAEKRKREVELLSELLMGIDRIGAHAENHAAFFLKPCERIPEITGLLGASRGIVLRIKIKDDVLPSFKIGEAHLAALRGRQLKIRSRLSRFEGAHGTWSH